MKKFFYLATALVLLASCSSDEMINDSSPNVNQSNGNPNAIVFNSGTGAITRGETTGADAATLLGNNFVVEGAKGSSSFASKVVFDNYNVNYVSSTTNSTTSNTKTWEYVNQSQILKGTNNTKLSGATGQSIKYWDYSVSQYDFVAFSFGQGDKAATPTYATATAITPSTIGTSAFTLTGTSAQLENCYVSEVKTVTSTDYNKPVQLTFRNFAAKIRLAFYETIPGYSVKELKFYTASNATSSSTAALYLSSGTMPKDGTYKIYYPNLTDNTKSDYKRPHLTYTAAQSSQVSDITYKALGTQMSYTSTKEGNEANGSYLGRTSSTASYAYDTNDKEYFTVMPNDAGQEFNLKVDYTLVSIDGSGEEINVTGATAKVPAVYTKWTSNYAYTYLFKISQDTNGSTGGGVAGLYPITFDAVISNDEVANFETITTVTEPSITTYALGVNPTTGNEYPKSVNIYITVPGVDLTSSNAELYKVTLGNGAAQTINEATVANCIANGTLSGSTYTVTDANGITMTATNYTTQPNSSPTVTNMEREVEKIAASDTPDNIEVSLANKCARIVKNKLDAGTYAFEYNDGSKKHYKIIIIHE